VRRLVSILYYKKIKIKGLKPCITVEQHNIKENSHLNYERYEENAPQDCENFSTQNLRISHVNSWWPYVVRVRAFDNR
jgi:hypothetical protein